MDASVICRKIPPMKPVPILLAVLALAACSKPGPPSAAAAAKPTAAKAQVMDISQPITANGTEPFWSLSIDGASFRLARPDHPDLTATSPGAAIRPGRATWVAMGPDGQMTVTLSASPCSDGMSDRTYPMRAEVVVLNRTLRGCAAKTAELAGSTG
jgi:uncharacterized membrane protein